MSLQSGIGTVFSWLYRKYRFELYSGVNNIRGTTRLLEMLEKYSTLGIEKIEEDPKSIFELEWDNLVILDACRHDLFEDVEGRTDHIMSIAGCTPDFIRETFSNHNSSDTVLITANPHFSQEIFEKITGRKVDNVFHEVFHTYQTDWDEQENTVLPKSIVRDAKTAENLFPDKRKIIWFMQPHYPFVSNSLAGGDAGMNPDLKAENESVWKLAMRKKISYSDLYEPYKQNLELVMDSIENVVDQLSGATIITSDHGNFLGENGLYGHSMGDKEIPLRKVPYVKINKKKA